MTVHILLEHPVPDFERWKRAFDSDPVGRAASGVRAFRVLRPIDDPGFVAVDLEFEDLPTAQAFRARLIDLWRSPGAQAVMGDPVLRIVEAVDAGSYPR